MSLINQIKTEIGLGDKMWGTNIPPVVNLISGVWIPFLETYEPQSFLFKDTNECSQLGGFISPLEKYFNWAKANNMIPESFLSFLLANGYWNGTSFAFSERYIAILDGTSINGNVMQSGYRILMTVGLIPRSMLEWTLAEAALYPTEALMDTSYYSKSVITPAMTDLGQQFLSYIQEFQWGWWWNSTTESCPLSVLKQALQTSPVGVAVPVDDLTWNQTMVPYNGGTVTQHCVSVYNINTSTYPTCFTDQYQPWLKQFASNYFIPVVIGFNFIFKPEPTAVSLPKPSFWPEWITSFFNH